MFAVPGWAVSADNLKSETAKAAPSKLTQDEPDNSKKRKRPSSGPNVTASNVADLWEQVIEGRSGKKAKSGNEAGQKERPEGMRKKMTLKEKKKLKKLREKEENERNGVDKSEPAPVESPDAAEPPKEEKKNKKRKPKDRKESDDSKQAEGKSAAISEKPSKKQSKDSTAAATPAPPAAPKLTPLQAQMREKLVSARFRHLNETLYTKPSADAFQLFADAPEMFQEYHEGFRRQVDVWPENPVDGYIEDVRQRGRQRAPQKSKHGHAPNSSGALVPLPRTGGTCTVADLGCGDAKLASALQADKKKLKLEVLSYDLQSPSPLVTKADIADLPLEDGSVNVVVFCLALMGTNWLDFVEEAYRVLHWKGELWVAEIKSRFGPAGGGKNAKKGGGGGGAAVVAHSVGNRRKTGPGPGGKKGKGKDAEAGGENDEAELAVEVDGVDDRREETDVSAFVEALRKRGFVLQGEVDLKNKMFVKMHFLKAAPPSVGKGAVALAKESAGGRAIGPRKSGIKFIDAKEDHSTQDEASILKPCVYKLR
ncbi:methyltransferase-domain-containing protein [Hypoxylon sp. FL1150]|nr:methyltransferase-domain-containing protein [Hypoxylon sp. FL1150]